jgi:hypothetical protein
VPKENEEFRAVVGLLGQRSVAAVRHGVRLRRGVDGVVLALPAAPTSTTNRRICGQWGHIRISIDDTGALCENGNTYSMW